uniref:GTP-binding protein TypA/BipA like protein n=1 Tax=Eufriesea mexicana TaxID=516756 RepID=A0A310SDP0_9HYME
MCIHIGGGRTDIAIISNNSILFSYTTRCAGDYLTRSVQEYIAKEHALKLECFLLPRLNSQPEQQAMSISETIEITLQEIRENVVQFQLKENVIPAIHRVLRTAGNKAAETISDLKKKVKFNEPLQMQISSLDYDGFIGRIGIGTLFHGTFSEGQEIIVVDDYDLKRKAKIKYLFVYHGLKRVAIKNSVAGDIVCVADGLDNDEEVRLTPPTILGVEKSLEFIATGESVAVTPQNVLAAKDTGNRLTENAPRNGFRVVYSYPFKQITKECINDKCVLVDMIAYGADGGAGGALVGGPDAGVVLQAAAPCA